MWSCLVWSLSTFVIYFFITLIITIVITLNIILTIINVSISCYPLPPPHQHTSTITITNPHSWKFSTPLYIEDDTAAGWENIRGHIWGHIYKFMRSIKCAAWVLFRRIYLTHAIVNAHLTESFLRMDMALFDQTRQAHIVLQNQSRVTVWLMNHWHICLMHIKNGDEGTIIQLNSS